MFTLCCNDAVHLYNRNLVILFGLSSYSRQIANNLLPSTDIIHLNNENGDMYLQIRNKTRNYIWDNIAILCHGQFIDDNYITMNFILPTDRHNLIIFLQELRNHTSGRLDWFSCNMGNKDLIFDMLVDIDSQLKFPKGISVSTNEISNDDDWILEKNTTNEYSSSILQYLRNTEDLQNIILSSSYPSWFSFSMCRDFIASKQKFLASYFENMIKNIDVALLISFFGTFTTDVITYVVNNIRTLACWSLYLSIKILFIMSQITDNDKTPTLKLNYFLSLIFSRNPDYNKLLIQPTVPNTSNLFDPRPVKLTKKYLFDISPFLIETTFSFLSTSFNEIKGNPLSRGIFSNNFGETWEIVACGNYDRKYSSVVVYRHTFPQGNDLYVINRGTMNVFDVFVDLLSLTTNIVSSNPGIKVPDGVEYYYSIMKYYRENAEYSNINSLLNSLINENTKNIIFEGNSVAGGFATLQMYNYLKQNSIENRPQIPHLVTFSAMKSGNMELYNQIRTLMKMDSIYIAFRIYEDIIPTLSNNMFNGTTLVTLCKIHDSNSSLSNKYLQFSAFPNEIVARSGKNSILMSKFNITQETMGNVRYNHSNSLYMHPDKARYFYNTNKDSKYNEFISALTS